MAGEIALTILCVIGFVAFVVVCLGAFVASLGDNPFR